MRHSTKKYLEDELFNYRQMSQYITDLRQEIMDPHKEEDENIGGGRSNSNVSTVEIKATRLVNDKRLKRVQEVKQAIETVYNESGDIQKQFLDIYYFTKPRRFTIPGVAEQLNVSESTVHRMKKSILKALADEIGIFK